MIAPLVTGLIVQQSGSCFPAFVVAVVVRPAAIPVYGLMVKGTSHV
ncbi:MAG: hypothetical protein ACLQU1_30895 [Bryobacteraceae bacterium]